MGITTAELHHQHKTDTGGAYHASVTVAGATNTRVWVDGVARTQVANFRQPLDVSFGALLELDAGQTVAVESDGEVTRFTLTLLEDQ